MAIYARGSVEFAAQFEDQEDPDVRRSLIELHTHLVYEKQLRNLQLQEARLVRRREKETAELRRLQKERAESAERPEPTAIGFEFSNTDRKATAGGRSAPFSESEACLPFATEFLSDKTALARPA
jgi:hypothetical protein